jgi:large subunit ribosomal protein L4
MLLGALRSALSAKLADAKLTVVDGWQLDSHKTQALVSTLEKLSFTKSALLVAHGENRNLELCQPQPRKCEVVRSNALQPYEVLKHDRLVLSKDAVARLVRSLEPEKKPIEVPDVESIAAAPVKKETAAKKPPRRRRPSPQ